MNKSKKTPLYPAFIAIFCCFFAFSSCGYEKNETDYVNEIEAAENEIGDPTLKRTESDNDTSKSQQPARIDGQEGHPAQVTEEDND